MPEGVRKGSLYTIIGFGASGILLFLFNVVAARVLGPSMFGILSILYSLIAIITPLLVGGLSTGLIRFVSAFEAKGKKEKIHGTLRDGFTLWICSFLLALAMSLILRESIKARYLDHSSFLFVVFILGIFSHSLLILIHGILGGLRELRYKAIITIVQYSFMLLFLLGFVLVLKLGINGASATLFGGALVSLIVAILICLKLKDRLVSDKPEGALKDFFNFVGPVTLSNSLAILLLRCGPLLIKTFGGIEANKSAGLFASVFALISVMRVAVNALSSALFPNLCRADVLGDIKLQRRYIKKSVLLTSALCLLMIVGFGWFGPSIAKIVYGKEFAMSRLDILLIAAMGGFYFVGTLLNGILLAKSLTKQVLMSWGGGVGSLILFVLVTKMEPLLRVEAGLCIANLVVFVLMLRMLRTKWSSTSSSDTNH